MFTIAMSYANARSVDIDRHVEAEHRKLNVQGFITYAQGTRLAQKAYRAIAISTQQLVTLLLG
jgi:hypothetical protein